MLRWLTASGLVFRAVPPRNEHWPWHESGLEDEWNHRKKWLCSGSKCSNLREDVPYSYPILVESQENPEIPVISSNKSSNMKWNCYEDHQSKELENETIEAYSPKMVSPLVSLIPGLLTDTSPQKIHWSQVYSPKIVEFPARQSIGRAPSAHLSPRAGSAGRANRWEPRGSRFAWDRRARGTPAGMEEMDSFFSCGVF